jgi:hypothetical protein
MGRQPVKADRASVGVRDIRLDDPPATSKGRDLGHQPVSASNFGNRMRL